MGNLRGKWMLLLLLIGMAQVTQAQAALTAAEENGQLSILGTCIVNKDKDTVQLRGMSLYWSQWQGKYFTYNTVKWLRDDWKCNVVRAAMGVSANVNGYTKSAEIAAAEKQKVKTVVDAAIDLGMYVIIDWHTHNGLNASEKAAAIAFFGEMAETYKGKPNIIYEIFNEPLAVSWADLKVYSEDVIAAIRAHDTENIIVCGTPNWSQDVDAVIGNPITKYNNIAYTLHFYAATHKEFLREKAAKAIKAGLCLMVTEFGTCDASGGDPIDGESSGVWFDFMDRYKLSWCNWSVSDVKEAASIIAPNSSTDGGWTSSQITVSGKIVRDELLYQYYVKTLSATDKPIISSQPSNSAVGLGMNHTLSTAALSLGNVSYQWFFNGAKIEGATAADLVLSNFSETGAGKYHAEVTNANGSSNTDTAVLSIVVRSPFKGIIAIPGTIEAENYDKGGNGYTFQDSDPTNNGTAYRTAEAVDVETSEEAGGYQVGYTAAGEWLEYTVNVAADGEYALTLYTASTLAGGKLAVKFGDGATVYFTAANTGSWKKRSASTGKITLKAGEQIVRFTVANAISFNVDRLDVQPYTEPEVAVASTDSIRFAVYPNPVLDIITVTSNHNGTVIIYNGTVAITSFDLDGTVQVPLHGLAAGTYYIQFQSDAGTVTKEVVKY